MLFIFEWEGSWEHVKNVPFAHLSPGAYNVQAAKTFSQAKLHKPDKPQWRLPLPWLFTLSFLEFTYLSLQKTTQRKGTPVSSGGQKSED